MRRARAGPVQTAEKEGEFRRISVIRAENYFEEISEKRLVASMIACAMPSLSGECAALSTITSSLPGQALDSSHAVVSGGSRSSRPCTSVPGIAFILSALRNRMPSSSQPCCEK